MDVKRYKSYRVAVTAAIGGLVAFSAILQIWALSMVGIAAGITLLFWLRRRVEEVTVDERVRRISEIASKTALQVFGWVSAATAFILIELGIRSGSANFEQAGYTLAYATCALLIVYSISYKYYGSKLGD